MAKIWTDSDFVENFKKSVFLQEDWNNGATNFDQYKHLFSQLAANRIAGQLNEKTEFKFTVPSVESAGADILGGPCKYIEIQILQHTEQETINFFERKFKSYPKLVNQYGHEGISAYFDPYIGEVFWRNHADVLLIAALSPNTEDDARNPGKKVYLVNKSKMNTGIDSMVEYINKIQTRGM